MNIDNPNIIERRGLAYIKNPYSIVLYLLDPSPSASLDTSEQLELLKYIIQLNPNTLVAINKVDAFRENAEKLAYLVSKEVGVDPFKISARTGEGLDRLINEVAEFVEKIRRLKR